MAIAFVHQYLATDAQGHERASAEKTQSKKKERAHEGAA
jgi:hypothetical protein